MSSDADLAALRERIRILEAQLEHFRQQDALRLRSEELLQATLNSVADGILAVDECGRVIASNRQFQRMWHIPPDLMESGDDGEMLNFVLNQLVNPDEFLAKVRELYDSFQTSQDTLHFHDGRVFLRFSLPLVVEDKLVGRVWTFRDAGHR